MSSESLKKRINNCEVTVGSWITLGHSAIAEIMLRAGYDWLVVDLEHSTAQYTQFTDFAVSCVIRRWCPGDFTSKLVSVV